MKKNSLLVALATIISTTAYSGVEDLLLSEVKVVPTAGEFIEIYNNGPDTVDLTNVYITDGTKKIDPCSSSQPATDQYYYKIVISALENIGGGNSSSTDFHARFPNGATLAPDTRATISIAGATTFNDLTPDVGGGFTEVPTYELVNSNGVPDMLEARSGSIANAPTLSNGGEVVILYYWDGASDLVQDLDYLVWGDKCESVDKSGVLIDGPDAGFDGSTYASDTAVASQDVPPSFFAAHDNINSWQRTDFTEGNETSSGGNGITGHDETSEDTSNTWYEELPTPNSGPSANPTPFLLINELDAVGSNDFVEIYDGGAGNTSLNDVTVIFYDGATDTISNIVDLSGNSTNGSGYYLLDGLSIEDGADAVAIYFNNASNYSLGGPTTLNSILDAIVYDSGQADDAGLLPLLNLNQGQVNENSLGTASSVSNSRCSNGSGGQLNTASFEQVAPSPGLVNSTCVSTGEYYENITPTVVATPALLRSELHNLIDDHNSGSYTFAWTILQDADVDPSNPNSVRMVYSNETFAWMGGGPQAYNREHTWPQSYGFHGDNSGLGSNNPARTDAHHLMLSNEAYNGRRGNAYYDNCLSGCSNALLTTVLNHSVGGGNSHGDSNWRDNTSNPIIFETWDFRKGDVARAMFYMDVRYAAGGPSDEVDLELTDNTGLISTGQRFMGKLSTLCQWHVADPVDQIELDRNDVIFGYQDNRNPFVDHPEWVEKVFTVCVGAGNDVIFENGFE